MSSVSQKNIIGVLLNTWLELPFKNASYVRVVLKKNYMYYVDDWKGYLCERCISAISNIP